MLTSVFRSKLLEKCKKIFKEELANMGSYITGEDQAEKDLRMKQFTLGSKKNFLNF